MDLEKLSLEERIRLLESNSETVKNKLNETLDLLQKKSKCKEENIETTILNKEKAVIKRGKK